MKKMFALLLVAIMALSMVACGADKTATTEAPRLTLPLLPLPLRRRRPCPTSL